LVQPGHGRAPVARRQSDRPAWQLRGRLFFIISGFVISVTLERGRMLADFLVCRFARLYPAFLASLILTVLVSEALGGFGYQDAGSILANLSMAPALFDTSPIDGSYWSLLYELAFYGLAGCVFFGVRPRGPELSCAIWLCVCLALRFGGADRYSLALVQLTAAPFCQLFVIGIMLSRHYTGRATIASWAVLWLAFALTLFGGRRY
jgi:peptidoglycan/LPS O-acetylase OafA/YrhL